MNELISPRFSRLLAVALFILSIWLVGSIAYLIVSKRAALHVDIADLRKRFDELRERRVDVGSLERQLSQLASSTALRNAVIAAGSERIALARLQQVVRSTINEAHGRLLSTTELPADRSSSVVALQVRARIAETSLTRWIGLLESGEPRLSIDEMSAGSRPLPSDPLLQIEVTATLRARWLALEGSTR